MRSKRPGTLSLLMGVALAALMAAPTVVFSQAGTTRGGQLSQFVAGPARENTTVFNPTATEMFGLAIYYELDGTLGDADDPVCAGFVMNPFGSDDDVLDYEAEEGTLGKAIGDDFREGKMTLPVVLAYAQGSAEDQTFWRRCLEDLDQRDGDLEQALKLFEEGIELTRDCHERLDAADRRIVELESHRKE